jgi:hypothetical protein
VAPGDANFRFTTNFLWFPSNCFLAYQPTNQPTIEKLHFPFFSSSFIRRTVFDASWKIYNFGPFKLNQLFRSTHMKRPAVGGRWPGGGVGGHDFLFHIF